MKMCYCIRTEREDRGAVLSPRREPLEAKWIDVGQGPSEAPAARRVAVLLFRHQLALGGREMTVLTGRSGRGRAKPATRPSPKPGPKPPPKPLNPEPRLSPSPSPAQLAVLIVLLRAPDEWLHGYRIYRDMVRFKHTTVYKALVRLNDAGFLEERSRLDPDTGRLRREVRLRPDRIPAAALELSTAPERKIVAAKRLVAS
jgi:hypothetical protein